jgi:hypothetical protein
MKQPKKPRHTNLFFKSSLIPKVLSLVVVAGIVILGIHLQNKGSALGPYAVAHPGSGDLTNPAYTLTGSSAANGNYVEFGSNTGNNIVSTTPQALVLPTHFDDTDWYWPSLSNGYTSLSINITPEVDGSPDGYFFANEFYFMNNPSGGLETGYLGLQTKAEAGFTGKLDIFSIWGAEDISDAQYTTTYTEEGSSGLSGRNSYQWLAGDKYTLTISYMGMVSLGEQWGATVTNDNTGTTSQIAIITAPASYGLLSNIAVSFHERYDGEVTSCSAMQPSQVEFTSPTLNGIAATNHTNYIPQLTDSVGSNCSKYYGTIDIPGGYESAVGQLPN